MQQLLSDKQLEFIVNSNAKWNIAHGSVSSGKTIGTLFRFFQACERCPDSQIWMIGHTSSTIYDNAIRLILEARPKGTPDPLSVFRPFCSWKKGERELLFKDKTISTCGAKDSGAIGAIQGKTFSLCYCDEMTLYPESIIDMIDTRVRNPHSMAFCAMNPSFPTHKLKQWIDKSFQGDKNYYSLHFTLEDNPFLEDSYKQRIKHSLSGVFYRRNYLGEWCLAEGSIFDFFDRKTYVVRRPPTSAEYFIVGLDYGTSNAFAAVLIGVNTGRNTQTGRQMWVEKEYYWDSAKQHRQKVNSEYAEDIVKWLDAYPIKCLYTDPSAESFSLELRRRGLHVSDKTKNDVMYGIEVMTSEIKDGRCVILDCCTNLIREIEGYVWNPKSAKTGEDEPLKQNDHAVDALRYALASHKVTSFDIDEYNRKHEEWLRQRFHTGGNSYR